MSGTNEPNCSYDVVRYPTHPFAQTHPDRLATMGALFGLKPQPIDHCRVLEIGCAGGGNLVPMAEQLPGSEFVGIDLSELQIRDAREFARRAATPNVELHRLNLLEFDDRFGSFDYILCHGVFSWVPRQAQDKILDICAAQLNPQGIAYVSYNTYPGWHMRDMIRDMMCYHVARFPDPATRIQQARNLLDFLAQNASEETAFGKLLKSESQLLGRHDDAYLFHEHLEETNEPIYFFQFIRRAEAVGLQYLGEAEMSSMWTGHLPPQVTATLERVASNLIQMEQYLDFVRNRTFRQTLLCRRDLAVDRELRPGQLSAFHVASGLAPRDSSFDLRSTQQVVFRHHGQAGQFTTSAPLIKAALAILAEAWPASVPYAELVPQAWAQAHTGLLCTPEQRSREIEQLGRSLLQCYVSGLVELHSAASRFGTRISDRPMASRVARAQVEQQRDVVTNMRHERVRLDAAARQLLRYMDGTRGQSELVDALAELVDNGTLAFPISEKQPPEGQSRQARLTAALQQVLTIVAANALLVE